MVKIRIRESTLRKVLKIGVVVLVGIVVAVGVTLVVKNRDAEAAAVRKEERVARREAKREAAAQKKTDGREAKAPRKPKLMYDIEYECYNLCCEEVKSGQTLSHILGGLGLNSAMIDKVDRTVRPVFNMRNMRAGQPYTAFMKADDGNERLEHFVYEKNVTDYVVVSIVGDSVAVREGQKEVTIKRRKSTATIKSSLWNSMVDNNLPVAISCELEDIFGWSIDFFGLQDGDEYTVIYDERYIDTLRVGIGRVWGAEFTHGGKNYHAIPFNQNGKVEYWDDEGKSMRKQLLKAPLKFSRISSKFTNARLHPILKVYRPHHGVDYAAPAGTPVVAIADGTVTVKSWDKGGGGNMLKIKHANNLTSGYLHLQGYAKGVAVGKRVSQGEVIGYVGSTGRSTGPHLDFRLWKGTTPIDPLKAPSNPVEPISQANMAAFKEVRDKVLAELHGDVPDDQKLTEI